jgi:hypothetical protein
VEERGKVTEFSPAASGSVVVVVRGSRDWDRRWLIFCSVWDTQS